MAVVRVHLPTLFDLIGEEVDPHPLIERLGQEVKGEEGEALLVDVNPDRPDLYSVEGMARAIKGLLGKELGAPRYEVGDPLISATVEVVPSRPFVLFSIVRGVRLDDQGIRSLMDLQEKLHMTYGRKRRKVAIGIHDLDKVSGNLVYRASRGETFIPLGSDREMSTSEVLREHPKGLEYGHILKDEHPVILDEIGIISFPPVINSARTAVTEETENFLIDVTGTDLRAVSKTINIVTTSLAERGGAIEGVRLVGGAMEVSPDLGGEEMRIDRGLIRSTLGLPDLSDGEIDDALLRMRITPKGDEAVIPPYRTDIFSPIDLAEEVEKGLGLERLEPRLPRGYTIGRPLPISSLRRKVRISMIGMGYLEITTLMMTSPERDYDLMLVPRENGVAIANPVSGDMTTLRSWLLPSLLRVLSINKGRETPMRIFEIGEVRGEGRELRLAFASMHPKASISEAFSVLSALMATLGLGWERAPKEHPSFIGGRCASIKVEGREVGFVGELHPQVLLNHDIEMPVAAGEVNLNLLFNKRFKRG